MYSLSASSRPSRRWSATNCCRVALEADEEQAGVELAELGVDAVGERVAAAQDPLAAVLGRRGEPDVGVDRDHRLAVASCASRSSGSNSSLPAERRAAVLVRGRSSAPGRRASRGPRPRSASGSGARPGRCRRASRPARSSPTQTCSVQRLGRPRLDVVGAVLEAHQVARRLLRAAGATTCGRSRAATSASPRRRGRSGPGCGRRGRRPAGRRRRPGRRGRRRERSGSSSSPGEARAASASAAGRVAREAEAVASNSVGPKPKVTVSRAGGRPTASPVSSGGARRRRRSRPTGSPGGHPRGRRRPLAQQVAQLGCDVGDDVEGGEVQPVLRRRRDPGLVRRRRTGTARAAASPPPSPASRSTPTPAERDAGADRAGAPSSRPRVSSRSLTGPATVARRPGRAARPARRSTGSELARVGLSSAPCRRRSRRRRGTARAPRSTSAKRLSISFASAGSPGGERGRERSRTRPARPRRSPRSRRGRCASSAPPRR